MMKLTLTRRAVMAAAAATLAIGTPAMAEEKILDSLHFLIPGGAGADPLRENIKRLVQGY